MDEFNLFFNRLYIGHLTKEQIELIKSYMYYTWDIRQDEINELKARISELESDNEELRHILRSNP